MKQAITFILILVLLSGCNETKSQAEKETNPIGEVIEQTDAEQAKERMLQMEEVKEVKAVTLENDLYVAVKVKQFDRLRLKKIRQNGFKRLEKDFPEKTIHVSTDRKIFMELEKLETDLQKQSLTKRELEKKLKKIDEDMKG